MDPETFVWANLVTDHWKMLHTKFQASEPFASEENGFEYFSIYFYGSNPVPPSGGAILDPETFILTSFINATQQISII